MSHFSYIKTHFRNLLYLEKVLNKLNIPYRQEKNTNNQLSHNSLILSQSNGHDIKFVWNGQNYELVADINFWDHLYPMESFIDKMTQTYAGEVIIGESKKIGFEPVQYHENSDGSNTLVLERWNSEK